MELTLVSPGVEPILTEFGKDLLDMGWVLLQIIGVYQDVIQVYNYGDVNHIRKNVIHEPLETHWGIGEPLGHYKPLERPVLSLEGGFPFIAISNMDEVVGMSQVDLGVDPRLVQGIQ